MRSKVGIGVTTYNRYRSLEACMLRLLRMTVQPFCLVVADDGSEDETAAVCARHQITRIMGRNMGIAWNKNRALFFLNQIMECDVTILIEDDSYPNASGWERNWIAGAERWGHINFCGDWFRGEILSGAGSVEDPFVSRSLSGQCASFSRRALSVCGYLDPRFKGYGFEHAEHSSRLVRSGFGGEMRMGPRDELDPHYYLFASDLTVRSEESYRDEQSMAANWQAWTKMYGDPVYRHPWRTKDQFRQFREEMALATQSANFSAWKKLMLNARWVRWRRSAIYRT